MCTFAITNCGAFSHEFVLDSECLVSVYKGLYIGGLICVYQITDLRLRDTCEGSTVTVTLAEGLVALSVSMVCSSCCVELIGLWFLHYRRPLEVSHFGGRIRRTYK